MPARSLNSLIPAYREVLANGDFQATYQSLVGIVQELRTGFSKKYRGAFTAGNVLHGYIDVTYFYLQNEYLKKNKLKFAIVLNHQEANFELWLLGQTKDVQASYWRKLKHLKWVDEHSMPKYSVFEITLLDDPDFDHTGRLFETIRHKFESLSREILETLESNE